MFYNINGQTREKGDTNMILRFRTNKGCEQQWYMGNMSIDLTEYVNSFKLKGWYLLAVQHHVPMNRRRTERKRGKSVLSDHQVITNTLNTIYRYLREHERTINERIKKDKPNHC